MDTPQSPNLNHLLAALPTAEFERIAPHLELVELPLGEVLYESGCLLKYVYFPTTAIVSLHYVMENGASAEIAGVGNEGVVGVSLFMGGNTTTSLATVQTGGCGYRLKGRVMMEEFDRAGAMMRLMLRYTQALMTHMSQTAVCNRHHSVEQQLCRWLLMNLDRLPSNELIMTQELVARMLGVRREGVTEAAGNLQRAGLISYRRGHITVLDRAGLEPRACECYTVVKKEFQRLLCDARNPHAPPLSPAIGRPWHCFTPCTSPSHPSIMNLRLKCGSALRAARLIVTLGYVRQEFDHETTHPPTRCRHAGGHH